MISMTRRTKIINLILQERDSQDATWGEQNFTPELWATLLGEEYGEFCEAVNETVFENGIHKERGGQQKIMYELCQIAAVAVSAMECLMRKMENDNA